MTRIGVTGPDADAAMDAIEAAGGTALTDSPAELVTAGADVLVALGEDALYRLVAADATGPIVPVDAGPAAGSVPPEGLESTLDSIVDGDYRTTATDLLAVTVDGDAYRALSDVMVVTSEPAKISEYGIHTAIDDEPHAVDTVRADGVVVATPHGSQQYASDARGPILAPDADTVSVVPIAPFRIERTHWGLTLPVTITVERDESDVSLLVDGTDHGPLADRATVQLTWGNPITLVRVAGSRPYFD